MRHEPQMIEAVRRLKGQGLRNVDIAMAVGMKPGTITGLCHRHGIKRATDGRLDLSLGARVVEALRREAHRRNEPLPRMMRDMIRIIVEDDLFAAVLDK